MSIVKNDESVADGELKRNPDIAAEVEETVREVFSDLAHGGSTHEMENELARLAVEAGKLKYSESWNPTREFFIKAGSRFDAAPMAEFGGQRDAFNAAREVFESRYQKHVDVQKRCGELRALVDAVHSLTGKFDSVTVSQVGEMRRKWGGIEPPPPQYMEILERDFERVCRNFEDARRTAEKEWSDRAAVRLDMNQIRAKVEALVDKDDLALVNTEFGKLRKQWRSLLDKAENDGEATEIVAAYDAAAAKISERRQAVSDAVRAEAERLSVEIAGLSKRFDEAVALEDGKASSEAVRAVRDELHALDADGDKTAAVLSGRIREYFIAKHREYQERDLARWEHYTIKLDLCDQAESMLNDEDMFAVSKAWGPLFAKWRAVGHVPKEKSEDVWRRFKTAMDAVKAKCDAYFAELAETRAAAKAAKEELCVAAEELRDSTEWRSTADKLKNLQQAWKDCGSAGRRDDQDLYKRFRAACDLFFSARSEHFGKMRERWDGVAEIKAKLCADAEALDPADAVAGFAIIRELRAAWKRAGSAGHREDRKFWDKFNQAIEGFSAKVDEARPANLAAKRAVVDEVEAYIGGLPEKPDMTAVAAKMSEFEERWRVIGPGPKEEERAVERRLEAVLKTYRGLRAADQDARRLEALGNLRRRGEIIETIEALAAAGDWESAKIAGLRDEWTVRGELPKGWRHELEALYEEVNTAFDARDAAFFVKLRGRRGENLKRRVEACVEMENLAGVVSDGSGELNLAQSLAEELSFAILSNSSSGARGGGGMTREEKTARAEELRRRWPELGVVSGVESERIQERFNKACEAFFKGRR